MQRYLSANYDSFSNVQKKLSDIDGTRKSLLRSLDIRAALSASEPSDAKASRDLAVALRRLSEVDPPSARENLTKARAILKELADAGKLPPRDAYIPKEIDDALKSLDAPPSKPAPAGGRRRK